MTNNNFRIDSTGFYRNRKGGKIEIIGHMDSWYSTDLHGGYNSSGVSNLENADWDIIAKWEEPQINSDNSKVNVNALERIAGLESALRQLERILTYDDNYSAMDMHKIIRDVLSEQHSQTK